MVHCLLHTNTSFSKQYTDTQTDTHTDRHTQTDTHRQTQTHMTLTVSYKASWCMTVHHGALQSLTVLIEWCNMLAQTLNGPGCLHIIRL